MVLMIKSSFISAFCKTICTTTHTQGGPGRMGARVPVLAQPTGTGFITREVQKITFYTGVAHPTPDTVPARKSSIIQVLSKDMKNYFERIFYYFSCRG